MKTSESITAISPALLKAQKKVKSATKDATNPHFKSRYADLSSVIDACKAALNDEGISFLQPVSACDSGVVVETLLLHTSGEWISESLTLPVSKQDAQGVGSAITYGRRYGLQSMVGVPAEDDDGNAASKAPPPAKIGSSARDAAVEALSALDPETQRFLHGEAVKIIDMAKEQSAEQLHSYVESARYDTEEKLGLWCLLPSDVRSKIKRGKVPTNGELSTQP